mgnify:CR=1 FL=1
MNAKQRKSYAAHAHLDADRRLDVAILILLGARVLGYVELVPAFATHWYAAGELQAEMERRGYALDLGSAMQPGGLCWASFDRFEAIDSSASCTASALTVPGAIARAAYHVLSGAPWEEDAQPTGATQQEGKP